MSYKLVPFEKYHASLMDLQSGQSGEISGDWWIVAEANESHSLFFGTRLVALAGLIPCSKYRASVWAMVCEGNNPRDMIALHRAVGDFLDYAAERYHRLDTVVSMGFVEAHRWAKMLGFTAEGVLRCYDDDKNDCVQYARINDGRTRPTRRSNRSKNWNRYQAGELCP